MAITLKLARTADFEAADIESKSLLAQTDGFYLERGSWQQVVGEDGDERVEETMTLGVQGTSHDDLATKLIALDQLLDKARWYKRTPERYGLWLRSQLTNETNARQALITKARRGKIALFSPPASPGNLVEAYPLTIERMPLWEATAYTAVGFNFDSVGGVMSCGTIAGSAPARIAAIRIIQYAEVPAALTEFWGGFRTAKNGTLANFVSPWELELGTAGTDTAATTDATASPGGGGNTKMACTFTTTTTMASRVTLTPYQISNANYADQRGVFDLILRAKCAAGVTALVRLSSGLSGTASYSTCNPVSVTGTGWKLYYLGRITLPAGGKAPFSPVLGISYNAMKNSVIRIEAELIGGSAGANALDMDCVVPIPVDEGHFHMKGSAGYETSFLISPVGNVTGLESDSGGDVNGIVDTSGTSFECAVPVGAASLVLAAQRAAGSTLTDDGTFEMYYFAHYRTLRGAV